VGLRFFTGEGVALQQRRFYRENKPRQVIFVRRNITRAQRNKSQINNLLAVIGECAQTANSLF
jgi:hypothetical protein